MEKAVEEAKQDIQPDSKAFQPYFNTALSLSRLNRFDEAKAFVEQAFVKKLDNIFLRTMRYRIAYVEGDAAAMQQQLDWANDKPEGYWLTLSQSQTLSFGGQIREANKVAQKAIEMAEQRKVRDLAAQFSGSIALQNASLGLCQQARSMIRAAIELQHNNPDQAIQLLQPTTRYESVGMFWPNYLRAQAYLKLQQGANAATEYQKMLNHRGWACRPS